MGVGEGQTKHDRRVGHLVLIATRSTSEEDLLTGVGQDYEAPESPELVLDGSGRISVGNLAEQVWEHITG